MDKKRKNYANTDPIKLAVGKRIRGLREELHLSQEKLFDALYPDYRTRPDKDGYRDKAEPRTKVQKIGRWESGTSLPDAQELALLCDFFQCDADYLTPVPGSDPVAFRIDYKTHIIADLVSVYKLDPSSQDFLNFVKKIDEQRKKQDTLSLSSVYSAVLGSPNFYNAIAELRTLIDEINKRPIVRKKGLTLGDMKRNKNIDDMKLWTMKYFSDTLQELTEEK